MSWLADVLKGVALQPSVRWTASDKVATMFDTFVNEGWMLRNTRAERAIKLNHAGFVTDYDLYAPDELENDAMHQWLKSGWGLGYCTGQTVNVPTGDVIIFDWERRYEDGPIKADIVAQLDALKGHLARAALMSSRLGLERAKAATTTLAVLGLPAAVLSPRHTILAMNPLLEDLMPSVVEERAGGHMHLANRQADALFLAALVQAKTVEKGVRAAASAPVLSVPVPGREGRVPMVVHVMPVRRAARDIFTCAATIVIVTPVSRADIPSATLLQGLFDLTPAEARVARQISAGETVNEIAEASKHSPGTVREHLKSIFAKTGVSRQADLVGLLGNLGPGRTGPA